MFDALNWAMNDAPVRDAQERLVLESYAMKADGDGCNAFPSMRWLAERTMLDERTIKDRRAKLIKRGLLRLAADQSPAHYIPANRRPKVYEVMVPYSWWSREQLERINRFRADRGRPPITPESRPDLSPAPRNRRADAGQSSGTPRGASTPPQDSGGTYMPPPGGTYMPPPGGTYMPPNLSLDLPPDLSLPRATVEQSGTAVAEAEAGRQEEGDQDQQAVLPAVAAAAGQDQAAAAALIDGLPWPAGQAPDPDTRDRLRAAAAACLTAGHPQATVSAAAADGIPGARRPAAVVLHRLRRLAAQPPDQAAAVREQAEQARREAARTPHPHEGPRAGYCARCGHHETHRVHRRATPATAGSTTAVERCAEHGRRVCVTCHGARPAATTGSTSTPARPATGDGAMSTVGSVLAKLAATRQPAGV